MQRAGEEELEVGPLLHVLAAQRGRARVGASSPTGASWIVSALRPDVPFFVAAGAASDLFADDDHVHLLEGGWAELAREAPFDLLVAIEPVEPEAALGVVAPGGTLVVERLTRAHQALFAVELPGLATLAVRSL